MAQYWKHAVTHAAACCLCAGSSCALQHDDPWKVRILPRVAFGVRPVGDDAALRPDTPGVVVLHHFLSSWQADRHRRLMQALRPLLSWSRWVACCVRLSWHSDTPYMRGMRALRSALRLRPH
jgi:hypothetical protein